VMSARHRNAEEENGCCGAREDSDACHECISLDSGG
jgi:hypothetical protein